MSKENSVLTVKRLKIIMLVGLGACVLTGIILYVNDRRRRLAIKEAIRIKSDDSSRRRGRKGRAHRHKGTTDTAKDNQPLNEGKPKKKSKKKKRELMKKEEKRKTLLEELGPETPSITTGTLSSPDQKTSPLNDEAAVELGQRRSTSSSTSSDSATKRTNAAGGNNTKRPST